MSQPKIMIFAPRDEPADILAALRQRGCDIVAGDLAWQQPRTNYENELVAAARDAVALMGASMRSNRITRPVLQASQRLRVVAKYIVGVDDVDVDAATELGILVCHAPTEENCFGVAETTMAMMLTILKKLRERDSDIRAGIWRQPRHGMTYVGSRLSDGYPGITLGLVGLGRIGARVADLMRPWNIRILAHDPYVEPAKFLLHNVHQVDYDTLLREADVVSFHVVLTAETRGMLGERELARMKPGAVVINTARGYVVDESALARAIESGHIRAAAVDAFAEEPLPDDSPLRRLGDKVLLSPHAASYHEGGDLGPGIRWATRAVLAALAGEVPDNVYNKEVIPLWNRRFGGISLTAQ